MVRAYTLNQIHSSIHIKTIYQIAYSVLDPGNSMTLKVRRDVLTPGSTDRVTTVQCRKAVVLDTRLPFTFHFLLGIP